MQLKQRPPSQVLVIVGIFAALSGSYGHAGYVPEPDFQLPAAMARFARQRCLKLHPNADLENWSDQPATHCFLQCFIYRTGLMNLQTRGLDIYKFVTMWDDLEEAFDEKCIDRFYIDEPLSGTCRDYYRKIMEFRDNCWELFEYTFGVNSTWTANSTNSKAIGQTAKEFCESMDEDNARGMHKSETSDSQALSFIEAYKKQLECHLRNYHFIDAYGRVDPAELLLSYQEAQVVLTPTMRTMIHQCAHRANSKFDKSSSGNLVMELELCLRKSSPEYISVEAVRNDNSRGF